VFSDAKTLLDEAKVALKRSKQKDYYKILGVEKNASEDEIRKAYKKKALVHHPDRHSNSSEADKKENEKKFKDLGEAYAVLSDRTKKMRYDSGQDSQDFGNDFSGQFDPSDIFASFFAGGGGGGGVPGFGMGGGQSFQFTTGGGQRFTYQ
jgi:DnaJ family protein C protein 7